MFIEHFYKNRFVFYFFLLLALLPVLISLSLLYFDWRTYREQENTFHYLIHRAEATYPKRAKRKAFLNKYTDTDPFFINRSLESLELLKREQEEIHKFFNHPGVPPIPQYSSNEAFSSNNRLQFAEEMTHTTPLVKETIERQLHPAEIGLGDLEKILTVIEGSSMENPPQIIIQNFEIQKEKRLLDREVFLLNMELIKREFFKK